MAQIHRTLWFRFLLLTLLSSMASAQLPVAEDTFVASGTTTPSGTNTNLQVIASPINAALVRFDLSGVPAGTTGNQVTKATVKLYVNTVSLSGSLDVCQVTSAWTEASTVFTSKPTLSATPLATAVPVSTASKYIVVDITTAVKAWQNGTANNGIALLPSSATPCNSSTYGAPSTSINVKLDSKENISASHDAGLNLVLSLTNGTVISVGTGEGLTGGPITTSGTISMVPPSGNTALGGVKGPNATATCAAGTHFSSIAMDGTLMCTADTVTSINFSAIVAGTNINQALMVGSGSSLSPNGGTITANMLTTGTYPISITGSAATATSAGTATNFSGSLAGDVTGTQSATVVSAIGGAAPSLFARRDQANTFTATQALAPKGNTSQPSNLLQLNATDASSNSLSAQLQALNDGSLSFQFGPTGSAVQKLFIDNTGKITFAPGQTFPGSQNLTAGTGIAINSNAIDNTGVLSFNSRFGAVSPQPGDYSFAQISGAITSGQAAPGLYGIDISGNANTANTAGSAGSAGTAGFATSAGDAANLGGQPAANYARLDIGNNFSGNQSIAGNASITGNATVTGNATITGSEMVNGPLSLPATGSGPSASQPLDLAGADGSNQPTVFRWQVNNTGKLDLLTATGGGSPMPSGLLIGSDGKITFAPNQTFPGTQSLTAGTGIAINGNAIDNTGVLSFNGRNGSVSPASGDYSFAQISGAITPAQAASGLYGIDITGNANTATTAGSAGTAATAGDASNLGGVPAASYARRDTANAFTGDQTVTGFVNATSSTGDAVVGTSTGGNAGVSGSGANGVVGTANGSVGSIGVRGDAAVVDGNIHFGVKGTAADPNSIAGVFESTGAGTAKVLSGQKNGTEVFSVAANGDVTGNKFTGDGSGLTNVSAGTFTGNITESQVTNLTSDLASKLTAASPLNAANLTGTVPSANLSGTYGINITGSAASALTAGSATTAGDASNLGGQPASNYARLDIGNAFSGNQTVSGFVNATSSTGDALVGTSTNNTGVSGHGGNGVAGVANGTNGSIGVRGDASVVDGLVHYGVEGVAADTNSIAGVFDHTGGGKILSGRNNNTEVFSVDGNGKVTGDGSGLTNVSAGTFTGSITESQVTNLTSDLASKLTAASPLNAANLTGTVPSANLSGTYAISISGNANTATTAGSAGTAATAGDASNLGGVPAASYARRDTANTFTGDQTVTGFVNAISSTGDAVVGTSTGGNAGVSGSGANGVVGTANGSVGSIGVRGDAAVVDGNIHFGVKGTAADPNSIAGVFDSTGAGTAKVLSGQKNGTEVFSVAANGDVTGNKFTGDGSSLTNVSAGTFTGSITESQVTNLTSDLASKLTAASPLNAANLTGTVPSANLSGTYGINITGSAASAATAGTATTATSAGTAAALQGTAVSNTAPTNGQVLQYNSTNTHWQPTDIAGNFIQNGTSQQATANFNISGTGVLGGSLTAGGAILPAKGTATSGTPFNSNTLDLIASSFSGSAVSQKFRWQAEGSGSTNTGSLNLLFASGANTPAETGLSIDNTGKITFAGGQTFPGSGSVTSVGTGTGLTGGPITSSGTISLVPANTSSAIGGVKGAACGANSHYSSIAVDGTLNCTVDSTTTSLSFGAITTGTNNTSLTIGAGGSLNVAGGGTINATSLSGELAATSATAGTIAARDGSGNLTATQFNGSGAGLTSLNASNITTGTVPSANLPLATTTVIGAVKPTIVTASATSATGANAGTLVTVNAACPVGRVLLGGGGQAANNDTGQKSAVVESYPSSATQWTVTGGVMANLANGKAMTVNAYAICSGS